MNRRAFFGALAGVAAAGFRTFYGEAAVPVLGGDFDVLALDPKSREWVALEVLKVSGVTGAPADMRFEFNGDGLVSMADVVFSVDGRE